MVESSSFGNSSESSCNFRSSSEIEANQGFSRSPKELCFRPNCCSVGNASLLPFAVRNAKRISDSHVLSFLRTISLLVRRHSVFVRTQRSIFPFPQWFQIGNSLCSMNLSWQNCRNCFDLNSDPGSVCIRYGTPNIAM